MKTYSFLIFLIFLSFPLFSATITSNGTGGGDWDVGATWAGGIVPMDGDDIIIAIGDVVRIDGTPDITLNNVTVTINGTLNIDDGGGQVGNLNLNGTSGLFVSSTGSITESVGIFGEGFASISVGGIIVWTACSNPFCVGIVNGVLDPDPEANGGTTGGPGGLLLPASGNPLPVEFIFFNASFENKNVFLEWATASEINNDFFEIERSFDAQTFEAIGRVEGAGNSDSRLDYQYFDPEVPVVFSENIFYRIRQVDFDGQFEYSIMVSIQTEPAEELLIRPNPFKDRLTLTYRSTEDSQVEIVLFDLQGREVLRNSYNSYRGLNDIVLNDTYQLISGTYILSLRSKTFTHTEKVVKVN